MGFGGLQDPICHLCDKPGTMQHDLSSCQPTLGQGRYRWRYDNVLRELADFLERERRKKRHTKQKACPAINCVKEGQTSKKPTRPQQHQSWMNLIAGR